MVDVFLKSILVNIGLLANTKSNYRLLENLKISLSTVVLNSRDRYENVWLPKNMRLEKQPLKYHHAKKPITTLLVQHYVAML